MARLRVTLRTPQAVLFDGEADSVRLKTDLGRMEILPDHATLVGTVLYSKVYIRHENTEDQFVMRQGSATVAENGRVYLLANDAHKEDALTIQNLQDYLTYLAKQLETGKLNDYQMQFLEEQRKALEEQMQETK